MLSICERKQGSFQIVFRSSTIIHYWNMTGSQLKKDLLDLIRFYNFLEKMHSMENWENILGKDRCSEMKVLESYGMPKAPAGFSCGQM